VGVQIKIVNGKIRILIINILTAYSAVHSKARENNLEFENIKRLHRLEKEILKVTSSIPVQVKYVVQKVSLNSGFLRLLFSLLKYHFTIAPYSYFIHLPSTSAKIVK
jgi:hypothetical protein